MDIKPALKKYNLHRCSSVHTAIRDIGSVIDDATDPLRASNRIIAEFGGTPVNNHVDAGIIARCMVEQAFYFPKEYNPEHAYNYGLEKVKKLSTKMPYLYASTPQKVINAAAKTVKTNDKAIECHKIFLANVNEKNAAIARKMVEQLGITLANATYYATKFRKEMK